MKHADALSTDQNSTKNASLMGKNTVPKSCVPNEILQEIAINIRKLGANEIFRYYLSLKETIVHITAVIMLLCSKVSLKDNKEPLQIPKMNSN